jgi:Uma2 family endonuclease
MATLIHDPALERDILAQRRAWGADRYDEVWEGVYVVSPMPNDHHQRMATRLAAAFQLALGWESRAEVRAGVNVSDRRKGWKKNYRVPDVAVFLEGTKAENLETHWLGGPDFGVEITSPDDQTREKIPFYEKSGTQKLLIIDRDPWAMELYRREGKKLTLIGKTTLEEPQVLESHLLGLTFELVRGKPRPRIRIRHRQSGEEWLV